MLTKKKSYDLVFSLGEACSCADTLKMFDLRNASYPFDWVSFLDFKGRADILLNDFENYFEKDLLEYVWNQPGTNKAVYKNKINNIHFNHDFTQGENFESEFEINKEKYDRRIKRLSDNIKKAKSILMVYIQIPNVNHGPGLSDEELVLTAGKILNKWPDKKIDIIYLINEINSEKKIEHLKNNVTKITLDYKDKTDVDSDCSPDFRKLKPIFKNYELTYPKIQKFQRGIIRFLIKLVPIKVKRQELRRKYHV